MTDVDPSCRKTVPPKVPRTFRGGGRGTDTTQGPPTRDGGRGWGRRVRKGHFCVWESCLVIEDFPNGK